MQWVVSQKNCEQGAKRSRDESRHGFEMPPRPLLMTTRRQRGENTVGRP